MAKIKHIAIATQDSEKTAQFYKEVFGPREIAKINSLGRQIFISPTATSTLPC